MSIGFRNIINKVDKIHLIDQALAHDLLNQVNIIDFNDKID